MVIIIGAGLSGLLTAYRLQKQGIPYTVLEARSRIGGRIHTLYNEEQAPVEMGATWFGDYHTEVVSLLEELNISRFKQHMDATVFYEPVGSNGAQQIEIPPQAASYRIAGGTSALIDAIYNKLDSTNILLNQSVKSVQYVNNKALVLSKDTFEADAVILALPPKLWVSQIAFTPPLPSQLSQLALQTHTWMEDSIKVAITYPTPFWEAAQKPSTLFSNIGPVTEFYNHENVEKSKFALSGFINTSYKKLSDEERKKLVINQLVSVFGTSAQEYTAYHECVWSKESHTHVVSESPLFPHQNNGNPLFRESLWDDNLFISSSESAKNFPGYMDGAISSANETADKIIERLSS
ncbi:NAD(P)/FAD-dependent oxidoreductase [Dokdonia sp. PRO95]|uniref:flavin monoamine oxidase family protein n=1 Tax=Dokdonia sp. PRO95 TaxID=1239415 RepID=UPI000551D261|nr:NAD(P)/FAD-dependent oxidoreductase [Dokdonia sp. PRO95]